MTTRSCDYAAVRMAGDRGPARECLVTGGTERDGNVVISAVGKTSAMWTCVLPKHWTSRGDLNHFEIHSHRQGWRMGIFGLVVGDLCAVGARSPA
jgi:hypothetical protein